MMHIEMYPPGKIPLHFYYFGWKKARSFVMQQGFYDPIELKAFELELETNLRELQEQFCSLSYEMERPIVYAFPKGHKNEELKLRPMSKIAFRDQVAWATVVLTLGEWFDTRDNGDSDEDTTGKTDWMVDWNCNNRLRRKYFPDETGYGYKRMMINYTNNDLYESFQRSLRLQRTKQTEYFNGIREKFPFAFYGQADIAKFYPSLKMKIVAKVLENRLIELKKQKIITADVVKQWRSLLSGLCRIRSRTAYLSNEEWKAIGLDGTGLDSLTNSLPTGLIAAGFLANCVLTQYLDIPLQQFMSAKTLEGNPTFATRYTDDLMIISSNESVVAEGLAVIKNALAPIELYLSEEKTRPAAKEDKMKSLMDEIETLTLRQAESLVEYLYKDELRCPRVGKFDALPKSTAIIDKLSQLGDQQVRAMRADELESFLSEVLGLIETEFAEGEIRDDTKASFAAWKIRKASNDARYRQLPVRESVTVTLRRNFMKYPYKMSLVNCYLIHLLEVPYEHEIGNFFSMMLQSAKKTDYVDQPGFYGGFIRTQIMFSLADNWNLVAEESRSALREMIFKEVCAWYADGEQPTWHEHYAVYWLFVNAGIDQEINLPLSEFDFVNRVRQLFLLMNHGQAAGNDPVLVAQMGTVWRRNRPRNASKQMSKSEFEWIAWVWRKIAGPPNVWKWKLEGHGRVWCELAWGRELCLTGYGFRRLMELTDQHLIKFFNGEDLQLGGATSEVIPIYNGLIEILNQTVSLYMENSDASFMKKFDQALKLMPEGARIRTYLVRRLANLKTITELFFPEDQQMKHFPSFVKGQAVDCIPLQDWLEVVSVAPRSFETSRIHKALLPLTETEITILAIEFIKKILKDNPQYDQPLSEIFLTIDNEWSKASLNRIGFSVESWIGWRNGEATAKVEILDNFVIFSEYYLSAWAYTTPFIFDRQYLICFSLAMLILRLISNKHDKFGAAGIMQLRGWSNISTIVSQAEFPSTVLAEIIAGFVNYQKPFYDQLAEQLDEELPLLPLEKEPIWTLREFLDRLDDHLTRLQTRFFIGDTGLREMRFIDIDKLVKE